MFDETPLLPSNQTREEAALVDAVTTTNPLPVPLATLWNPDTCPAEFLGHLAWALSVDVWEPDWSEEIKRDVIRQSIAIHRINGTIGAMRRALASLKFSLSVTEWFEHGGEPHTFRLDAFAEDIFSAGLAIDPQMYATVSNVVESTKGLHSHFDLRIGEKFQGSIYTRAAVRETRKLSDTLTPKPPTIHANANGYLRAGVRTKLVDRATHTVEIREAA